ncbi:MAG: sulfur carrier protein ThiS [Candidatus Binatus sp.]|jgi:sulfur carrier protein|uniref:sulfur carrier protein ThiS n=1 Tax=Candidatus Binatus sp. TaxID=2811406 RepID=UPI003C8741C6
MSDSIATAITLNGDPYPLDADIPLTALLERLNMRRSRVAVELNREIVPRASYDETIVRAGDRVEIINFVGGG